MLTSGFIVPDACKICSPSAKKWLLNVFYLLIGPQRVPKILKNRILANRQRYLTMRQNFQRSMVDIADPANFDQSLILVS